MNERFQFLSQSLGFYYGNEFEYGELASSLCTHDRVFARGNDGKPVVGRDWAYHFDNSALIRFLEKHAQRQGIELIDDRVDDVSLSGQSVSALQLAERGSLAADFFVDCSGFRSLLIGNALRQPWHSYEASLYCDRAVVSRWPAYGSNANQALHDSRNNGRRLVLADRSRVTYLARVRLFVELRR